MRFPSTADVPAQRDRVIDLLRAFSLAVVVAGHALMSVPVWTDGSLRLDNLLGHAVALQALTWLLQVMPLFFFAGGAASFHALRKHPALGDWVASRVQRLYRPVLLSLAFWLPAAALLTAYAPAGLARPVARLSTQLLWFLGCYAVALACGPCSCAPCAARSSRSGRCSRSRRSSTPSASPRAARRTAPPASSSSGSSPSRSASSTRAVA